MQINESGFSLIEILISVAIIGILSAIALPAFNDYRQRSSDTAAQSDTRIGIQLLLAAKGN
ncbi:type IV pilin protein [Stutzerimonas stutzeri]|uniref:type IV pilin protein n=1 Tax=Stutzerimonas stutzeri TaxID=316 RepID=UPI0011E73942|nr:prepilin-type N-terminal cleavage/methylation domain-containing protein [Stutzerimonas stutzeri]